MKSSQNNGGFTLVEVALVLIIGGVLLASAFAALQTYIGNTEIKGTRQKLDMIDEALQVYFDNNGEYPCPALMTAIVETPTFGVSPALCAGVTTTNTGRNAGGGSDVYLGAVPVRSLNLPDDFIADSWGNRFTYAVSENLTVDTTFDTLAGRIFVEDSSGGTKITPAGSAHYVIVSHGEDGSGATIMRGSATPFACNTGVGDEENCDGDATFRSSLFLTKVAGANFFDDLVKHRTFVNDGPAVPIGATIDFNLGTCPGGWTQVGTNGALIVCEKD